MTYNISKLYGQSINPKPIWTILTNELTSSNEMEDQYENKTISRTLTLGWHP
jgi:hypothetical protein